MDKTLSSPEVRDLTHRCQEAVDHLRQALLDGDRWPIALLEAMSLWTAPEEVYQGRHFLYLIGGEAFDWLLLAERLCYEVDGLIPHEEKEALLFDGRLPDGIGESDLSRLLGVDKYRGYLNYLYGVTVEEALLLAVEEEIRKQHLSRGYSDRHDFSEEAYLKIYRSPRDTLLSAFRQEKGCEEGESMSFTECKEFTYWLFKHRLRISDRAKVASDTRKGLEQLCQMGSRLGTLDLT